MKKVILCSFLFVIACDSGGDATGMFSNLTDFPFPIGVAGAGVYNDHVYVFGGSTNYDGDSNYSSIYKFTGSEWVQVDTMLNDATWDGKLLIQGNDAYYVSGWNGTNGSLQKYNFANKTWTVLDTGNISTNWGTTAQLVGNKIYHFAASGQLDIYDISANQWTLGNGNGLVNDNIRTLTSTVYNGNIYLTGYGDSSLYKYDVAEGNFTLESKMPRSI